MRAVDPVNGKDVHGHSHAPAHARIEVEHRTLAVESLRSFECIDITAPLSALVREVGLEQGFMVVQTCHTTTGVMINEHEPLLLADLEAMFERLSPTRHPYAHDDFSRRTVNLTPGERRNGHAHCQAALLRTSEWLAVVNGGLGLGRWQRVFLVELDGAQRREVLLTFVGALRAAAQ